MEDLLGSVGKRQTGEVFGERSSVDLVRCSVAVLFHPILLVTGLHTSTGC